MTSRTAPLLKGSLPGSCCGLRRLFQVWLVCFGCLFSGQVVAWQAESPQAGEDAARSQTFESVWKLTRDNFLDGGMNGVDWEAARNSLRPAILAAQTPREFSDGLNRMLAGLQTSHTFFWTRDDIEYYHLLGVFSDGPIAEELPTVFPPDGKIRYAGIDILVERAGGKWFLSGLLDGGLAARAGLRRGLELVSVDDLPFEPVRSFAGKTGQVVRLGYRETETGALKQVELTPHEIDPQALLLDSMRNSLKIIEHKGRQIAYAHLWSWAGKQYQDLLKDELLGGSLSDADGLVLDLREGWGGASPEYLNLFQRNLPVLEMRRRDGASTIMQPSWTKPVTLLVNQNSRSGKEVIAWGFREHAFGKVVGTNTGGAVAAGSPFLIGNHGVLYLAVGRVTVDGKVLEGRGVAPDVEVAWPLAWSSAPDPQLQQALETTVEALEKPDAPRSSIGKAEGPAIK